MPLIKKSIFGFLDDVQYNENLSMTIIKKYREKREMEIMKKKNMLKKKNEEMKQNRRKSCNDKEISNPENAENYDNDKNKVMKFFQKRGSLSNINEKPKIEFHKKAENENDNNQEKAEEKNEPINFLKENKIKIKNIKIVDNPNKNAEVPTVQLPYLPNVNKDKRDKSPNQGASEHMGQEVDLNKINEDQYNQVRYLQNLSRIVKEEEKQNDEEEENDIKEGLPPINEESIQNENDSVNFNEGKENPNNKKPVEDNKAKKEELNKEYKEIENLKNQIIKEIGNDIFNMVYKHVENSTDKTEIKFDMEALATKLSKEFGNKKYNEKKLNIAIEKLPEIFAIVIQDRLIKYNA